MKRLLLGLTLLALNGIPYPAGSAPMTAAMYGMGPHGFDWEVGTWSCANAMPSPMGGPSHTMLTIAKTNGGAIFYRSVGARFDNSWYDVYVASKKTWVSPFILADGSYGTESTAQTGPTMVWVGTAYFSGSGKPVPIRDTIAMSADKTTDLGEYRSGSTWQTQYNVTCTRT